MSKRADRAIESGELFSSHAYCLIVTQCLDTTSVSQIELSDQAAKMERLTRRMHEGRSTSLANNLAALAVEGDSEDAHWCVKTGGRMSVR